jgi:hypothetical protein
MKLIIFLGTEIDFWNTRLRNLVCVFDQLRDPRVKKMASILKLSDSAYFASFVTLFRNVVAGKYRAIIYNVSVSVRTT